MKYLQQQYRLRKLNKQKGFSLVAAFIVIAILMAVVAYFIAGQGMNTSATGTYSNSARASSLISQAAYIQGGVNVMITSGQVTAGQLTFDTATTTGLFNPSTGGAQPQSPDPSSYTVTTPFWAYRGANFMIEGVGTNITTPQYALVSMDLKKSVCEAINTQLHGSINIPSANALGTAVISTATATSPSATGASNVTLGTAGTITGWDKGCLVTTDPVGSERYFYYQILVTV